MALFIYTELYNLQSILANIILVDLNIYMNRWSFLQPFNRGEN